METIAKEYLLLFNAITDTAKALQALQLQLLTVQTQAEALFLDETGFRPEPAVAFTQDKPAACMIS